MGSMGTVFFFRSIAGIDKGLLILSGFDTGIVNRSDCLSTSRPTSLLGTLILAFNSRLASCLRACDPTKNRVPVIYDSQLAIPHWLVGDLHLSLDGNPICTVKA